MDAADYQTRRSRHGHGIDVRATYGHLPFQPFWTWLTGKDIRHLEPRRARDTLLTEVQLWGQVAFSWSVTLLAVVAGWWAYESEAIGWPFRWTVIGLCWILIVNRTRGLLHTFHYTNHGASITNTRRARWIGKYFMSIPILHTSWDRYHKIHAGDHHSTANLCSADDPDEVFMTKHGFRMGMPEREFWSRLVLAPFHPARMWTHVRFRLEENFVTPEWSEIMPRAAFWSLFAIAVAFSGHVGTIAVVYLFPLLVLTQFSSWMQHTTEHLWFSTKPGDVSNFVYYGAMTWGRFQGRPHPGKAMGAAGFGRLAVWWLKVFTIDLPIRVFAFMQDLPSHDFHHRKARVNFWSIARERAASEGRPSKYGPMAETWGMVESWCILRDHLCRGLHDPFGLFEWDRAQRQPAREVGKPFMIAAE